MKQMLPSRKHLFTFFFLTLISFTKAFAYDAIVAQDGSGDFTSVQAAINAAPTGRTTPFTIFVKNGKYTEVVNIPANKPFLQLIGESVSNTIITYNNFSGKPMPGGGTFGTGNSATVTIAAADVAAINITFENTTGEAPQGLAINVTGDRVAFKNCRFLGGQDTVFAGGNGSRQYFRNCYIDGTVDFIFGDARAVFDSCVIYPKTRASAGASYITAANTKQTEPYGYVFRDAKIPANRGGTVYYLGRPWQNDASTADAAKSYNKTIYLNTTMSSSVQPAGWSTWDAGTDVTKITYAEYKSKKFDGTAVDVSQRVSWSRQLTDAQAAVYYNNDSLFKGWNPCAVTPDFCAYTQMPIAISNFRGVRGTSASSFTWNISWPSAGVKYEVLRSSDKTSFTKVSEQTSPNDTTINYNYSESIPPPGVTFYYIIRASKLGYDTQISNDTVVISSTPTITVTGALGSFVQGVGTPSSSQSYVVSAASLTNNLIITAPAGYELSTNATTWNTSANPLVLTQDAFGNIANTTIFVRLNASLSGTYNGNIIHTSQGADTVRLAVTGMVQSSPLTVSALLEWWPLTRNNADSALVRSAGVVGTMPTLNNLVLSNGTTVPSLPAYSPTFGQAFAVTADGLWTTAAGGPGGNLSRIFYEQFTVKASATHSLRVDSLILASSFYNTSSNTKLAVVYSKSGFPIDSTDVTGGIGPDGITMPSIANGAFATPVLLPNEIAGTTTTYRFALAGGTGVTVASGDSVTIRLYYSSGSGSNGRYAKLKDVQVKGLATANPVVSDYRTHQSGVWRDVNTWERYDGTTWVYPAPAYPVYNNANTTTILNGHTVTVDSTLSTGSGYIDRTTINRGGQLIVNSGVNLNIANDGSPSTATTDLQVDGTLTLFGALFSNSNVSVVVNGSFVNAGTNMNLSNAGDTVKVGSTATWQHNVNNGTTPNAMIWLPGSTFLITGITTNQTGIFKSNITYGNIVWNNTAEASYYAFRNTLTATNVQGSFTVASTGTTYIAFANASGTTAFPGGYYQTGGTVNYRESGNIADTLITGADFSVTGGTFNSNAGIGSSLLVRLAGVNKSLIYNQTGATNTNWDVSGSYNLGANLPLASAGFGMNVSGTLNTGTYAISGPGNFTLMPPAFLGSGSPLGLNGNITATGIISLEPAASFIFNGTAPQVTGTMLPSYVTTLTINNAADVTLSNAANQTTTLTLTAGKLILGNNTIAAISVLNSSATRYVVTNGTGALTLHNIRAGANVFPVGPSGSSYNPATLTNAGTGEGFSVNVKTGLDHPVADTSKIVKRQWTITVDTTIRSSVTISLSWTTADQGSNFNPANATSIMRWNGTAWVLTPAVITGAGTTANPYVATAGGFTSFGAFAVVNDVALPLSVLYFNAGYVNNNLKVWWSTINELNAMSYEVERSNDGRTFTAIGSVAARNTLAANSYDLIDANPLSGVVYYRLKMTDKDGTFRYSKVVVVNSRLRGIVSVYPNPATNLLTVTHGRANRNATVQVIAVDGRTMITQKLTPDASQTTVDVTNLAAGAYTLVITNGTEKANVKFIKR